MLTDYKTSRITQYEDGPRVVFLRIYEGAVTTEDEDDGEGMVPVTRYRRTALLREELLSFPAMPEQALHGLLRAELAKDQTRTPIPEQRHD